MTVGPRRGADPLRVDDFTRSLQQDLRRVDGVSVTRQTMPAPEGAKAGEVAMIGTLLLSAVFSVKTVDAIARVIAARIQARAGWSVSLRANDYEITLTGPVPEKQIEKAVRLFTDLTGQPAADAQPASGTASPGPAPAPVEE